MFKKIKIGTNIIKAKIFNQRRPLSVTFSVTNRCNLRCSYCSTPERKDEEFSTNEILRLIDQLAKAGAQKLSFSGGEPLLRDDIGILIERAKEKKMYLSLTTNGILIKNKISALKNLDTVLVSIDGEQKVHDITGKAHVKELLESINLLKKNKVHVFTSTVLVKPVIEHLDYLLKLARETELYLVFQPYSYLWYLSLAGIKSEDLTPSLDAFKKSYK